jgi:hypothetical protein
MFETLLLGRAGGAAILSVGELGSRGSYPAKRNSMSPRIMVVPPSADVGEIARDMAPQPMLDDRALLDRGYRRPSTAVFVEMTSQVSSADREALLTGLVTAMDEMAASTKAAEKRAADAEQRALELEKVGGRRH